MKSPLSYLGGKSRLAAEVVTKFPQDHTCYVEPFCGACWVFFAKEPSKVEVLNDRDSELVTFWRVVQNHLEEFMRYYKFAVVSREIFDLESKKDPKTLTDIQRAVRYFYLQKLGFGGRTKGRTFGTAASGKPPMNLLNLEEHLLEVHWRFNQITIENLTAVDCIKRYDRPDTFFYLDPPYYETAGYFHPFGHADHIELARTLAKIKGRFMLSLNDHKAVREIYGAFNIATTTLKYSVGNSRKSTSTRSAERGEVFISNYTLPE